MKTIRGFEVIHFNDSYGTDCSIQESSAWEPHIWLGVHRAEVKIMYKDAVALGLRLKKQYPETNERGWCIFPVPDEALVESRMHLNREQARKLAEMLLYFSEHLVLPAEGGGEADKKTNCSDCGNRNTPVCKYCEHDAEGGGEDG